MDADPGQVIRSLRLALDMSQTEFARAAGWSPSTISGWERGRAKPSRLAFKTILAFAEERGVRYRPRSATTLLPLVTTPASPDDTRATAPGPGPRPALRPLVYPDRAANTEPGGDPDRLGYRNRATQPSRVGFAARPAETMVPPRWSAEASFRVTLGAGREGSRRGIPRGVIEAAVIAGAFCIALALHAPLRQLLSRSTPLHPAPAAPLQPPAEAAALAAASSLPNTSGRAMTASARTHTSSEPAAAIAAAESGDLAPAAVASARLESVMAIGAAARATFRTANDAVTVVTGEWLGAQRVAAITSEGVTLVDRAGVSHRIRVGQHTPFE